MATVKMRGITQQAGQSRTIALIILAMIIALGATFALMQNDPATPSGGTTVVEPTPEERREADD
ncbi:hypothetical protein [Marinobacter sp.]|uniref:hypothetical protein n=1 Tax=Marinobacter sp. TaxID=50741 RepID=UPI00384F27CA